MDRLGMIDDIRKYANLLMQKDSTLNYAEASKKAKLDLFGKDLDVPRYIEEEEQIQNETSDNVSYGEIASRELADSIRVELYTEEQLKEIIIAKRMGVNVDEFINIFYTPLQIRVITMASALGRDITPYTTNLYFDPEEELRRLESESVENIKNEKTYLLDKAS